MSSSFINSRTVREILETYRPIKKQSDYTRISLFNEPKTINRESRKIHIKRRGLSPEYWNINETEIKAIKSRSRLDDFNHDSISHLFPKRSPTFDKMKSAKLPPLKTDDKIFYRKIDNTTIYREEIFKLQKQGFFNTKSV